MPKNRQLFDALNNTAQLAAKDAVQRNDALDALMQVDVKNAEAFRNAILSKKEFWRDVLGDMDIAPGAENEFLNPATAPDFAIIQQFAIQQRIKLGLQHAPDQVIVDVLKHNTEELRAYLAGKALLVGKLESIPNWKPSEDAPVVAGAPPRPKVNKSTDAVADAMLDAVQRAASEQLFLKLVAKTQNVDALNGLLEGASLRKAATTLGYPEPGFLETPLNGAVTNAVQMRIHSLEVDYANQNVSPYVKSLSDAAILEFKDSLKTDNLNAFENKLEERFQGKLEDAALTTVKKEVGDRYIAIRSKALTAEQSLALLKEEDEAAFKLKFKDSLAEVDAHHYLDELADAGSIALVKRAALQVAIAGVLAVDLEALKSLDDTEGKQVPLAKFKDNVKKLFKLPNADWIEDTDLKQIKQSARSQILRLLIQESSFFGVAAHQTAMAVVTALPIADQRKLIANPKQLNHLLNAQDVAAVERILGRGVQGAAQIVEENASVDSLKGIWNAKVAQVLSTLSPRPELSAKDVDSINKAIGVNDYDQLVPVIKGIIKPVDEVAFDELFDENGAVCENIGNQGNLNRSLVDRARVDAVTAVPKIKRLASVFLSLDSVELPDLDTIKTNLNASATVEEFIGKFNAVDQKNLRDQLTRRLSAAAFKELKNESKAELFVPNFDDVDDVEDIRAGIEHHRDSMEQLKATRKDITKNSSELKPLILLNDTHLMNPGFQGKARNESAQLLEQFEAMSKDCDLVVDHLLREQQQLTAYLSQIPDNANLKVLKEVKKLKADLSKELAAVNHDLVVYQLVQDKLHGENGLIAAVTDAAEGKNSFVYKAKDITSEVITRAELDGKIKAALSASSGPKALPDGSASIIAGSNRAVKQSIGFEDSLAADQIRLFNFTPTVSGTVRNDPVPKGVILQGIYSEQQDKKVGDKAPQGKYQIHKFPEAKGITVNPQELSQARVQFSLAMAVQVLSNLDADPNKKDFIELRGHNGEQVRHLYHALLSLGVDKKAIHVETKAFNPDTEYNVLGMKKSTDFDNKENKALIAASKAQLQQARDVKEDKTGTRAKVETHVTAANKMFKEANTRNRLEEIGKTVEKEGPAAKPK